MIIDDDWMKASIEESSSIDPILPKKISIINNKKNTHKLCKESELFGKLQLDGKRMKKKQTNKRQEQHWTEEKVAGYQ